MNEKYADLIEIEKAKDLSLLEYEKEYIKYFSDVFSREDFDTEDKFDEINII